MLLWLLQLCPLVCLKEEHEAEGRGEKMDEREKWAPCCFHVSITELNQDKRTDILRKTQKKTTRTHKAVRTHKRRKRGNRPETRILNRLYEVN